MMPIADSNSAKNPKGKESSVQMADSIPMVYKYDAYITSFYLLDIPIIL